MFVQVLGKDKDVIEVDGNFPFGDKITEDVIHNPLEHRGWVGESKEHDYGFEQSSVHMECCLFLVTFLNAYIVITLMNVKLGEVFGAMKFGDEWKGVSILDRHFVQLLIVLDWS